MVLSMGFRKLGVVFFLALLGLGIDLEARTGLGSEVQGTGQSEDPPPEQLREVRDALKSGALYVYEFALEMRQSLAGQEGSPTAADLEIAGLVAAEIKAEYPDSEWGSIFLSVAYEDRHVRDAREQAELKLGLANEAYSKGRFDVARVRSLEALRATSGPGARHVEAEAAFLIAEYAFNAGNHSEAIYFANVCSQAAADVGHFDMEYSSLRWLRDSLVELDRDRAALSPAREVLTLLGGGRVSQLLQKRRSDEKALSAIESRVED